MTYAELLDQIQQITGNNNAQFVTDIKLMVERAEDRILRKAQLKDFRKNQEGTLTADNQYLSAPSDLLSTYSLNIVSGTTHSPMDFKDVSYIRAMYPDSSASGLPNCYAQFDDDTFLVGPTPDSGYSVELHYLYRPESIVTADTTWLGDNAETALLYATLIEAAIYMKSEQDTMMSYVEGFRDAMDDLKVFAEGYGNTDSHRDGEVKVQRA